MKDNQLYYLQLLSCHARFFSLKSFTSFKVLPTISFTYSEVTYVPSTSNMYVVYKQELFLL